MPPQDPVNPQFPNQGRPLPKRPNHSLSSEPAEKQRNMPPAQKQRKMPPPPKRPEMPSLPSTPRNPKRGFAPQQLDQMKELGKDIERYKVLANHRAELENKFASLQNVLTTSFKSGLEAKSDKVMSKMIHKKGDIDLSKVPYDKSELLDKIRDIGKAIGDVTTEVTQLEGKWQPHGIKLQDEMQKDLGHESTRDNKGLDIGRGT